MRLRFAADAITGAPAGCGNVPDADRSVTFAAL
jgi:hypothetical protein